MIFNLIEDQLIGQNITLLQIILMTERSAWFQSNLKNYTTCYEERKEKNKDNVEDWKIKIFH